MHREFFLILLLFSPLLHAKILEISQIAEIHPYLDQKVLLLFDVDDTLITNPFSLGQPAWRNWAKPKLKKQQPGFAVFDALTLYIAKKAPYKLVEEALPKLIADLQAQGVAVFGFTARG